MGMLDAIILEALPQFLYEDILFFFSAEFFAEYLAVMFCLTGMKQSGIS